MTNIHFVPEVFSLEKHKWECILYVSVICFLSSSGLVFSVTEICPASLESPKTQSVNYFTNLSLKFILFV